MGHRNKSKARPSGLRKHGVLVFLGVFMVLLWGVVAYLAFRAKPRRGLAAATSGPVPAYFARVEDAMPLPPTLDPAQFKKPSIRAAYQVAREIPGVLAQQPCYCYCERQGHRGLLDCFRTEHAATCNICIKEALLAGRMHHDGKAAEEIRAAIIQGRWTTVAAEATSSETNKSN